MATLEDHDIEMIRETRDIAKRLETLMGNGDKGLLEDIREHSKQIVLLHSKHNRLERRFILLIGFLVGSGILGGTTIAILKVLG